MDERFAFVAEVLCVIFVFVFVTAVAQSNYSLFAPLVFAIVVLVFSKEGGPISSAIKNGIFVTLGLFSYSIYLVQLLVERIIVRAALAVEAVTAYPLITKVPHENEIIDVLGLSYAQGNLWACAYLILVVGVSALTYRYVELPSRLWFRKHAQVERP
jgi:peptidoglycan/LPS O-acetylase OafA/YrhL